MTVKDFRNIILLIIVSIFITIVIPGVISALNGTFYYDDLKKKVSVDKIEKINAIDAEGKELDEQLKLVNARIRNFALGKSDSSGLSLDETVKLKQFLADQKAALKAPISLIPYYLNPQMLLWVGIYSSFLLLIYLIAKEHGLKLEITANHFGLSMLMYLFYEWPLWLRNFVLTGAGRTVFAYPNIDIDIYSFLYQELIIYTFCFLATVLIITSLQLNTTKIKLDSEKSSINRFLIVSSYYSNAYRNWFIHSTMLALGFLSFTSFFWRLVFVYNDQRYIMSALNAHVLWALCWIAISLNLWRFIQEFDKMKRSILRSNPDDKTLKIVTEHQPANNLTIIFSGLASLVTFLLPIIKSMIFN